MSIKHKSVSLLVASAGLCLILSTAGARAQNLFLQKARIVDPAEERVRDGNLLVLDGEIAGFPEAPPSNFEGQILDLEGRWVIPGLNDLHTHSYGNMAPGGAFEFAGTAVVAKRMLYAGVTGFLDLFGHEAGMIQLRDDQRAGQLDGADLFASLSCLTAPEGHCTEYGIPTRTMDSPEAARAVVGDLAKKKPDVVKIVYSPTGRMPSIDKATLQAAIETASRLGLKTVVHINTWNDVRDAVEAGASAVTHVPNDGPVPADLARLMADKKVFSIPTLAVQTELGDFIEDESVLRQPFAQQLTTEAIRAAYKSQPAREHRSNHGERFDARSRLALESVKTMSDAGVPILTGSDSGNWGTIQGYSLHRELVKLVKAGLTPWQALAASTTRAGEFMGRRWGVGVGDEANLVVLDASPVEDIRNTQKVHQVIHHGRLIDRQALLGQ